MASESDSLAQPPPEVTNVKNSTSTATELMNSSTADSSSQPTSEVNDVNNSTSTITEQVNTSVVDLSSAEPTPNVSSSNETNFFIQKLPHQHQKIYRLEVLEGEGLHELRLDLV